jgi:hypothetical protein
VLKRQLSVYKVLVCRTYIWKRAGDLMRLCVPQHFIMISAHQARKCTFFGHVLGLHLRKIDQAIVAPPLNAIYVKTRRANSDDFHAVASLCTEAFAVKIAENVSTFPFLLPLMSLLAFFEAHWAIQAEQAVVDRLNILYSRKQAAKVCPRANQTLSIFNSPSTRKYCFVKEDR